MKVLRSSSPKLLSQSSSLMGLTFPPQENMGVEEVKKNGI